MLIWFRKYLNRRIEEKLRPLRLSISRLLITLSSGAILLTFTFIQIIERDFKQINILKSSWILFGCSILFCLVFQIFVLNRDASWLIFSVRFPMKKLEEIKKLDKKKKEEFFKLLDRYFSLSIPFFIIESLQFLSFFIGVILIIIFMFYNLK